MDFIRDLMAIPFGYALHFLFELTNNYLLSLLIITLVTRIAMLPQTIKQQKSSAKQMRLQAKVNKIRAKYSTLNQREAQMKISEETQELYRREGFSMNNMGCLPMIIQLVVMMGLYGAIYSPLSLVLRLGDGAMTEIKRCYDAFISTLPTEEVTKALTNDYYFELNALNKFSEFKDMINTEIVSVDYIAKIENFIENFRIFGIDLTDVPSQWKTLGWILVLVPVFAGLTAMLTSVFMFLKQKKTNPEMAKNPMMGCMTFLSPLMSVMFSWNMPAGVGFYWILSNILSFIQTVGLSLALKPEEIIAGQMIDETVQRRSREKNIKIKTEALQKQSEKTE